MRCVIQQREHVAFLIWDVQFKYWNGLSHLNSTGRLLQMGQPFSTHVIRETKLSILRKSCDYFQGKMIKIGGLWNKFEDVTKLLPLKSEIAGINYNNNSSGIVGAPSSTLEESRHLCLLTFLYRIQRSTTFIWSIFRYNTYL